MTKLWFRACRIASRSPAWSGRGTARHDCRCRKRKAPDDATSHIRARSANGAGTPQRRQNPHSAR